MRVGVWTCRRNGAFILSGISSIVHHTTMCPLGFYTWAGKPSYKYFMETLGPFVWPTGRPSLRKAESPTANLYRLVRKAQVCPRGMPIIDWYPKNMPPKCCPKSSSFPDKHLPLGLPVRSICSIRDDMLRERIVNLRHHIGLFFEPIQ